MLNLHLEETTSALQRPEKNATQSDSLDYLITEFLLIQPQSSSPLVHFVKCGRIVRETNYRNHIQLQKEKENYVVRLFLTFSIKREIGQFYVVVLN